MFKHHINILSSPVNDLFTVNNAHHNYYTRQNNDLHINRGRRENVYILFSFHGTHIWNHIKKNLGVSYTRDKKYLRTTYKTIT